MRRDRLKLIMPGVLLLIVLAGAALRLMHIGTPSIWVDEAITVFSARAVVETGVPTMPAGYIYGRDPLYTYTVAMMFNIFGDSLENARLLSALFGILAIGITAYLAFRVFDWKTALFTAFLMSFSFYEIGWSRVARMYTLFQVMTICSVLLFLNRSLLSGHAFTQKSDAISAFFRRTGPFRLFSAFFLVILTVVAVHKIALLLLGTFTLIILIFAVRQMKTGRGLSRWLNRYTWIILTALFFGMLALFSETELSRLIRNFLNYTPAWAGEGSSASQRWVLFAFLFSWYRFPLGLLFIGGSFQIIKKRKILPLMTLLIFLIPLLMLTFVFTHRHPKYLFFVYPLFLMISAYGGIQWIQTDTSVLRWFPGFQRRWVRRIWIAILCLAFILSPWLRIAKNIPFLEDGKTNGAVYFNEWKEAVSQLNVLQEPGDLLIASLPEALKYYGIEADWALNWSSLSLSAEKQKRNSSGQLIEIYAAKPLIETLNQLNGLVTAHPCGWVVLTEYHFRQPIYIPAEIREYLENRLVYHGATRNGTVRIYHWDHNPGAGHAL